MCTHVSLSRIRLFVTPWTAAHQAPLSIFQARILEWVAIPSSTLQWVRWKTDLWVGGGEEEGARLKGWGEEQGEVGKWSVTFCCQFYRPHPPPGRASDSVQSCPWLGPRQRRPGLCPITASVQSIACPIHFGGLCYNDNGGALYWQTTRKPSADGKRNPLLFITASSFELDAGTQSPGIQRMAIILERPLHTLLLVQAWVRNFFFTLKRLREGEGGRKEGDELAEQ